jgi:hypothetical protein
MAGNPLMEAPPRPAAAPRSGWTAGRVIALAAGSLLLLISLALLAGSATLIWADQFRSGYLTTSTTRYSTSGYALASEPVELHGGWAWLSLLTDHVRIRVTPADPSRPVFAGIAAAGDVQRYLAGVSSTTVGGLSGHDVTDHPGARVPAAPGSALSWAAHVAGTGNLTLTWTVRDGAWMVVVMNPDATPRVTVRADAGVSSPALPWLATEMLAAGLLFGVAAVVLIIVPVRLATRS